MTLSLTAPSSLDNGAPFIRTEKEDEGVEPWEAHLIALEDDKVWVDEERWREFCR